MNQDKRQNHKKGFTLGEVVISVSIIGIVSTVAIPGFLRIRRDASVESVKQHMRVIGEKLMEIVGKKGVFPDESSWPLTGTTDPDEVAITASLSAIDKNNYTTDEYTTNAEATSYEFCSSPKSITAGTDRFCVHCNPEMSALFAPGQVGKVPFDLSKWDGSGKSMTFLNNAFPAWAGPSDPVNKLFSQFLSAYPSNAADLLANSLERNAYVANVNQNLMRGNGRFSSNQYGSIRLVLSTAQSVAYNSLFPRVFEKLESKGIHTYQVERTTEYALANCSQGGCDILRNQINANPNPKVYELTFDLDQPILDYGQYFQRQLGIGLGVDDWWNTQQR